MSVSRITFQGIAEAWIARGNGIPLPIIKLFNILKLVCEISSIGDIEIENILSLGCSLETENIDSIITLGLICENTDIGDIQPVNTFSISVIAVAS